MKLKTITLKGFANNSDLLFSENSNNDLFIENYKKLSDKLISNGYKKLSPFKSLRNANATEKIIIKGKYWRGSWSDPTKETYSIFYK